MGTEGTAGRLYWEGVKEIISHRVEFLGREHRGAQDAVNSLLNYGYGILYSQVWGAVLNAGLEPFAGFLHVDRPGNRPWFWTSSKSFANLSWIGQSSRT